MLAGSTTGVFCRPWIIFSIIWLKVNFFFHRLKGALISIFLCRPIERTKPCSYPCLIPLSGADEGVTFPFQRTAIVVVVRQDIQILTKGSGNPSEDKIPKTEHSPCHKPFQNPLLQIPSDLLSLHFLHRVNELLCHNDIVASMPSRHEAALIRSKLF